MISAQLLLDLSRISRDLACGPGSTLQIILFEAIFKGRTDIVRALLNHDVSIINSLDPTGVTPLVCSVLQKNITVCEALLGYKECNVNKKDEKGWTALHHAVNEGCEDVILVLLKCGAKLNCRTQLHKYTPLHIATYNNNLTIINCLKSVTPKVNAKDSSRRTVLHLAVENNVDINILRALLQMRCDPNVVNRQGLTPLMMAVKDGNINISRELIEHGADINIPDLTGKTPLYVATDEGHSEIIQILFQQGSVESLCPLNGPQRIHSTALHLAIYKEYDDNLITMLLREKTELEAINSDDQTPLMFAVYINKKDVVNTLINFGANRQTRDFRGRSPLFFVVKRGDFELCAALLGVLHEFKGNTDLLLSKAIEYSLPDYVQTCIQNGTRIMDHHMCSALDILGDNTILNILIDHAKLEFNDCVECLEKAVAINNLKAARAILEGNGDPNYKAPLARAATHDNVEMIKLLVEFNADLNFFDSLGNNALNICIKKNTLEAVDVLLAAGADPHVFLDVERSSNILTAIRNQNYSIVKLLLQAKTKPSVHVDELAEAVEKNELSIVKLLVNGGFKVYKKHRILAKSLNNKEMLNYFTSIEENNLLEMYMSKPDILSEVRLYSTLTEVFMFQLLDDMLYKGTNIFELDFAACTMLHSAASSGYLHVVKHIVKHSKSEDLNVLTLYLPKQTPLHIAARWKHVDIVELLIESGADINVHDANMETPLWISVQNANLRLVDMFLKSGSITTGLNIKGKSLIQVAVETGCVHLVQMLLQNGVQLLLDLTKTEKHFKNETFLSDPHLREQMLKVFIEHLRHDNSDGDDAALWAMKLGDPDILRSILKIDKNLINGRNKITGLNLLHHAVDLNHLEFVQYFECLEEFEMHLDQFCFAEETPLYRAIHNRRYENAALLVKCKANCELGSRKPLHSSIALANFLKEEYLVELMITAGFAPPLGWNRKFGINLQSITIIAIRNFFPQAKFRKNILSLQENLPDKLIKLLLLE